MSACNILPIAIFPLILSIAVGISSIMYILLPSTDNIPFKLFSDI